MGLLAGLRRISRRLVGLLVSNSKDIGWGDMDRVRNMELECLWLESGGDITAGIWT
jgi:hypothetical protein